jgi:hypothetical protein
MEKDEHYEMRSFDWESNRKVFCQLGHRGLTLA